MSHSFFNLSLRLAQAPERECLKVCMTEMKVHTHREMRVGSLGADLKDFGQVSILWRQVGGGSGV